MQKQLCFGLGIALFCVAAVVYYCANNGNSFNLRTVGEAEALTVNGGGQAGASYSTGECGGGTGQCIASGYIGSSGGDKWATAIATCGGNCGNITVSYGPAPE
jgi:hypothetical protein